MTNEELADLAHQLRTQDNRMTAEPLFLVMRKRRIYGLDLGFCDQSTWLHVDGYEEADLSDLGITEEQAREDEMLEEVGYMDIDEFVTAHFTMRAAEQYIRNNGHRHSKAPGTELFVYVDSMYRCPEMIKIRKHFLDFGKEEE